MPDVAGASLATWRDGVHLSGTEIWCDAPRVRELSFVSNAEALVGARCGQLVATSATLGLLGATRSRRAVAPESELAVPLGRPFSLGALRLELFASGHGLGAASLRIDGPDGTLCFAGVVHPRGTPLAGAGDVRRCDGLIVDATFAARGAAFPPFDECVSEIADRAMHIAARGGACILAVDSRLEALDIATGLLAVIDKKIAAHRRIGDFARAARRLGHQAPRLVRAPTTVRPGALVLWPAPMAVDRSRLPRGSEVVLCSGRALFDELAGLDHAIPISAHADEAALLRYVEQTRAREVMLTGGISESLVAGLARRGANALPLGPPEQLRLNL